MKSTAKSREEIVNEIIKKIPDEAFDVINELLLSKTNSLKNSIKLTKEEIISKCKSLNVNYYQIIESHLVGIILSYRKQNWIVANYNDYLIFQ